MASVESKNFDSPDEVREFTDGKGHADLISIAGKSIGKATFEPGWKWSNNVKPIAQTDSCQTYHVGYVLSGQMRVFGNDGTETEAQAGDVFVIEPGHDAEVIGDEACVTLEFGDAASYARPS